MINLIFEKVPFEEFQQIYPWTKRYVQYLCDNCKKDGSTLFYKQMLKENRHYHWAVWFCSEACLNIYIFTNQY